MKKSFDFRIVEAAPLPVRLWVSLAIGLLALILILAMPAHAQDVTDAPPTVEAVETTIPAPTVEPTPAVTEQPPVEEQPSEDGGLLELAKVAAPWLGAIAIAALIVAGVLGREALVRLGKSQPAYAREPVFSAIETGMGKLAEYTQTTETTIDDAAAAELKKFLTSLIADIRAEAQSHAAPNDAGS